MTEIRKELNVFCYLCSMFINEETWNFVRRHQDGDVRKVALQGTKEAGVDLTLALQQIAGWQTARRKLPTWAAVEGVVYPPHLNMEQCSSEQTARYKARIVDSQCLDHELFVDLTGGLGVDFYFMSQGFSQRIYVEQNPDLCALAEHNFRLLDLACSVCCCDTAAYLAKLPHASVIFLDPARRNEHGGRTYSIEDCSPNVLELLPQLMEKADKVVLKLSPMLDWHQAVEALKYVTEVHIVSVDNECKELLLVLGQEETESLRVVCVNGDSSFEFAPMRGTNYSQAGNKTFPRWEQNIPTPGKNTPERSLYLYEPNASVMKAGCYSALEERFPIQQVAQNSHLFLSHQEVAGFPGRRFQVLAVSSMNKKELTATLSSLKSANIAVRNFPMTADELRKKLKLKDGGDTYIFATTVQDGQHRLFICRKIS